MTGFNIKDNLSEKKNGISYQELLIKISVYAYIINILGELQLIIS